MHHSIELGNWISYLLELVCINLNIKNLYNIRRYLVSMYWKGHTDLHYCDASLA